MQSKKTFVGLTAMVKRNSKAPDKNRPEFSFADENALVKHYGAAMHRAVGL